MICPDPTPNLTEIGIPSSVNHVDKEGHERINSRQRIQGLSAGCLTEWSVIASCVDSITRSNQGSALTGQCQLIGLTFRPPLINVVFEFPNQMRGHEHDKSRWKFGQVMNL